MALTGQLSDMSLAELIEFFCNQRKTGRLKIDYPRGHSVFFIKEGELVDAKVGSLSGPEAVYFSLTLPNAAFDFSPDVQATRRTIDQAWTQVVLEGLRRLDEGLSPTEADAFGSWSPSESELAHMLDQVEHLGDVQQKQEREKRAAARAAAPDKAREEGASSKETSKDSKGEASPEPFSMMVEGAGAGGGSKKKFVLAGVGAAVVLACAVAAVPLLSRPAAKPSAVTAAAPAEAQPAAAAAPAEAAPADTNSDAGAAPAPEANAAAAAEAARREERERRERERRERERREDAAAKKEDAALNAATDPAAAPKPATPSGPKSVRVSVSYDEAGRVTQASVAGSTPGAEAYGSTAVRIARGKRFPAGKPGSTVITIPVN
ncbi:MAG TPA: TonB family protein [Pyrinomonadaceae bacterium]